ncbi:hypothetical protein Holit_02607 [Hollandina sp. SP2]
MKKLIAISLALTLVAGAAFAEVAIGGLIQAGATVISGSNAEDSVLGASGWNSGRLQGTYTNDEGTFGAHVKVNAADEWWANSFTYAWWKPISQIRVFGGKNPFGEFGINYIVGWGWHASDAEDFVAYNGYGFTRTAWSYAGWDTTGFALTLTPIDGLAINLAVPYGGYGTEAAEIYNHTIAQAVYNFTDVGELGITYTSGGGYRDWQTPPPGSNIDPGMVRAQFYLTAVEHLQLNIGLKYTLGGTTGEGAAETTYVQPITAGFGLNYNISDTIGVKARLAAGFAGSTKVGGVTTDIPLRLGFDVMPYFDLSILKLFLNLGVDFTAKEKDVEDSQIFVWYLNPYITKSVGGSTFYAGFQLYSDGKAKDAVISWGIPVGIQIGF